MLGRFFPVNMVALVRAGIRRQVLAWHGPEGGDSFHNFLVNALIMVLTIAAVFYVVSRVTSLFTEKTMRLRAGHMECFLTSSFIALHTRSSSCFRFLSIHLTEVTSLVIPLVRYEGQDDWLHGGHIPEPDLGNI